MHGRTVRWCLALALVVGMVPAVAGAMPVMDRANGARVNRIDNRVSPLSQKQDALKATAMQNKLEGKKMAKGAGGSVRVAEGEWVELAQTGEDKIWTVLGEFNDFPHNNIAKPDRRYDNTTIWVPDFSRDYFMRLLFGAGRHDNSMLNYYKEQSSGQYSVSGDVTDWVKVPGDAATYDDDTTRAPSGDNSVWFFIQDSVDGWYAQQVADAKSPAEINAYLSQFDRWDRYDFDHDGVFNEPDGYIDHFQSLHAGEGNEAGGGTLKDHAIWSHSWYAFFSDRGKTGPSATTTHGVVADLAGGVRIGDSDYWVGDYTIQPENGGVGVFTHEFAHDLGLPDLYDTSGGENGTGFWTLMSSGSWLDNGSDTLGNKPGHMGVWEKWALGWISPDNYAYVPYGETADVYMGPSEYNTTGKQALFVELPDKVVTDYISAPYAGSYFYYSGAGNNLDNKMYRSFDLGEGGAGTVLTAKVNYAIEPEYDYAYVIASTDGGDTWKTVPTDRSTADDNGIDGFSGGWVDLEADLSSYQGDVLVGFSYVTDGGLAYAGFMADDIQVAGGPVDGAETDAGWTYSPPSHKGGFRVTTGTETGSYANYYVAEVKSYWGYDSTLKVGPYNFGWLNSPFLQNWVEHFPYQDGLLINYWDTSQVDNNTSEHPGSGYLLPIDAHPKAMMRPDGYPWRSRVQTFDATFGLDKTDAFKLHAYGKVSPIGGQPAVSTFSDLKSWWDKKQPLNSVIVPKTGTQIKVLGASSLRNFMQVRVSPAR